ncbi:endolytic transglycosylase MltG [Sphingomonadaceae bacterium OTU29LAMAA1]|uniref:endolytic transglycosylase MltG n=1 Tax=Sphingomonas sp. Leaf37 TaxID=2876552 RepID=UPI001E479391|nr:endolytic transglycosylase MltG [Sphingomonas sp. Leaf37]USU05876.1 endolytic transglycosylase MltG [Sphingomonadaceae bacterium OTU29LAMAA1]
MRKVGCLGLLIGLAAIVAAFLVVQGWGGSGPAPKTLTVQVAEGSSLAAAARELEQAGAIRSASRFRLLARVFGSGEPIKAGEYRIPARTSPSDILKMLQGGKVLQRLVVVPEGYPSVLVHDALAKADGLTGSVPVPAEGSVLPDSYAFQRGDTRASVVTRMQTAMRDYLAQAWTKRKPGIAVSTPEQAIILASIVEKETGKPSERRTVAAVYANRLKRGMPLQADPTVIYPITKGRPLGRRILRSELRAKNGYNTYAEAGLPAGPIANPGRASIDAVLDPAQSNALYFVADGTGGHVFADTLDQHNANVRKWYAIRRQRGEM